MDGVRAGFLHRLFTDRVAVCHQRVSKTFAEAGVSCRIPGTLTPRVVRLVSTQTASLGPWRYQLPVRFDENLVIIIIIIIIIII